MNKLNQTFCASLAFILLGSAFAQHMGKCPPYTIHPNGDVWKDLKFQIVDDENGVSFLLGANRFRFELSENGKAQRSHWVKDRSPFAPDSCPLIYDERGDRQVVGFVEPLHQSKGQPFYTLAVYPGVYDEDADCQTRRDARQGPATIWITYRNPGRYEVTEIQSDNPEDPRPMLTFDRTADLPEGSKRNSGLVIDLAPDTNVFANCNAWQANDKPPQTELKLRDRRAP